LVIGVLVLLNCNEIVPAAGVVTFMSVIAMKCGRTKIVFGTLEPSSFPVPSARCIAGPVVVVGVAVVLPPHMVVWLLLPIGPSKYVDLVL